MQTQTSNTLHNAIMEAGSKDRPPMLAPGIDNDIYSTVDACPNACEMWKAIERLKQGESINVQDLETNLFWEFGKFTSLDGESLESYYSRFYKMMNELTRNQSKVTNHQVNVQFLLQLQPEWQRFMTLVMQSQELKNVSYHKLYDILKQHQHEVNEIRAEKIARVANPLALVPSVLIVRSEMRAAYATYMWNNAFNRTLKLSNPSCMLKVVHIKIGNPFGVVETVMAGFVDQEVPEMSLNFGGFVSIVVPCEI
nr:hypothetical protein [Tanacetum cinerariifolium]